MEEQRENRTYGMNIGGSSLIMVFSVLCLTIFAVLTFLTANSEYKLANKSAQIIKNYYYADTLAVEKEAEIRMIIDRCDSIPEIADEVMFSGLGVMAEEEDGGCRFTYAQMSDSNQEIQVQLFYDGTELKTEKWMLVNMGEWGTDSGQEIWEGDF